MIALSVNALICFGPNSSGTGKTAFIKVGGMVSLVTMPTLCMPGYGAMDCFESIAFKFLRHDRSPLISCPLTLFDLFVCFGLRTHRLILGSLKLFVVDIFAVFFATQKGINPVPTALCNHYASVHYFY